MTAAVSNAGGSAKTKGAASGQVSRITASLSIAIHGKLLKACCELEEGTGRTERATPAVPTLAELYSFIHGVSWRIQIEPECLIVALIYIDRAAAQLPPDQARGALRSWDLTLLSVMALASCLWDDISASPKSFAIAATRETKTRRYRGKDITRVQWLLIDNPRVRLSVSPRDYREYYYNLERVWTRVGLVTEPELEPIPLHPFAIEGLHVPREWHLEYALVGGHVLEALAKGAWDFMSLTSIYRRIFYGRDGEDGSTLFVCECDASAGIGCPAF